MPHAGNGKFNFSFLHVNVCCSELCWFGNVESIQSVETLSEFNVFI